MNLRGWLTSLLATLVFVPFSLVPDTTACCPAPRPGQFVVNADQTVIIVWDAATKTEHFIRKATFKAEADDFGFLIPTPTLPALDESGNEAFPYLAKLTEPEIQRVQRPKSGGGGCACGPQAQFAGVKEDMAPTSVVVRAEKEVAGFKAVVLEAKSANDLVKWLKDNGYAFSPEIEAWAKPYVETGWMITAFKVARAKDDQNTKTVAAGALRMTFKTDRPLFPYREPDYKNTTEKLPVDRRLLRIYFLGDARYAGALTPELGWTGRTAYANPLSPEARKQTLAHLRLPETAVAGECWLTEFEDDWPYEVAPADLYFSPSGDAGSVKRPPIIQYVSSPWPQDVTFYALAAVLLVPPMCRRLWKSRSV